MTSRSGVCLGVVIAGALVVANCGSNSQPSPPPSSEPIPITGNERLGWSQSARSQFELQEYAYVVYVDGLRTGLPNASCAPLNGASASCESPLPPLTAGQHVLEIATYAKAGAAVSESPKSAPLVVVVSAQATFAPSAAPSAPSAGPRLLPATRRQNPECGVAAANGLTYVVRPSGRIVRFDSQDRATTLEWRTPGGETLQVRDVTVDSAADPPTHRLYLLLTDSSSNPGRVVIARYREVGDVLGEAAVIYDDAPGLPLQRPVIRFGPDGQLYVAFLEVVDAAMANPSEPRQYVLRLNPDGTIPAENPSGARELPWRAIAPAAFTWDFSGEPWVVERVGPDLFRPRRVDHVADGAATRVESVVAAGFPSPMAHPPGGLLALTTTGTLRQLPGGVQLEFPGREPPSIAAAVFGADGVSYCGASASGESAHGVLRYPY